MVLGAGANLGPYEILAPLGAGGMGEVYRARDSRLGRQVAIKVSRQRFTERFENEVRTLAALNHPNICTIHDVGPNYLVMELLEGETLADRIKRGSLEVEEALTISRQVADGLAAAQVRGIVHRDLKPGNIMLTQVGVKILDFGLAKTLAAAAAEETVTSLTEDGIILGTPHYMAPEQVEGRTIDFRTDVFAFGIVLYEMLAGTRPFESNSRAGLLAALLRTDPLPIGRARAGVPLSIEQIVRRCLEKEPARRFPSMAEVRSALAYAPINADRPSIAVLPFLNMSPDKENEYFSDGLTEDIIDALTKLAGLRVVARGSSFAFRGRENAVREIAEKLKVETVLHGSVRRAGSRIRVTAQLISIADESQLWSERYDRELTDIFAIQDEIAHAIVDTLEVKLIQPIRRKGFDLHAHSLYQKGIFHFPRWSGGNIYTAIRYLEEAVKTDRSHAPAWLALADCHLGLAVSSLAHPRKEVPTALECAREAVAADDRFEDAQVQLRYLEAISLLNWRASLERSEQALRENPDSHRALVCHSGVLMAAGESGRAIGDLQRIIELDPLSPLSLCILARAYAMEGRFDRTAEYSRAAIDLYGHHWALASLGSAYVHLGRIQEGIGLLERARTIDPGDSASGLLCDGYARVGRAEQAIAIFEMLVAKRNSQYISASTLTECAAAVGDMDGAFRWLDVAIEERDPQLLYLPAAGSFPAIRADQRYREVRRKMSLDSIDRQ